MRPSRWRSVLSRFTGIFGGRREKDLDAEIREHLDLLAAEYQQQGLGPEAARQAARRDFGGIDQIKELYSDQRRFRFFETLWQDMQYGFRSLMRAPGFSVVAVLTLAFGILANTTIFSAVNAVFFQPLPIDKPEQIVAIFAGDLAQEPELRGDHGSGHAYRTYKELRDNNDVFTALAAVKKASVSLVPDGQGAPKGQGGPVGLVQGEVVSGNYFDTLGIKAAHGRTIRPDDDRAPNAHPVVVISDRLWRRQFNAAPDAIGRVVRLNGNPFTIVGIAPASFTGSVFAVAMDFWAPLMMQGQLGSDPNWWRPDARRPIISFCKGEGPENCSPPREWGDFRLLGRLKPDMSVATAGERLTALNKRLGSSKPPDKATEDHLVARATVTEMVAGPPSRPLPGPDAALTLSVLRETEARHNNFIGQIRRVSALALVATVLVWLVACGNVANLALARATVRTREIAIRLALGAGRWRVARQLLTESTMLAVLGGALAGVLTFWTAGLLGSAVPPDVDLPLTFDFTPDARVLGWALALALVTGVVFGFAPTWQAARTNLIPALKPGEGGSAKGARRLTLRNVLVVGQLSMSVVVLVAGILFARSVQNARAAFNPGYETEQLISMRFDPGVLDYKPERYNAFYRDILEHLKTVPRVESASLVDGLPFCDRGCESIQLFADGGSRPSSSPETEGEFHIVGPRAFQTLGIPLVAGREFTERDDTKTRAVAILNIAQARKLFGTEQQAIGRRVRIGGEGIGPALEVVGVVGDQPGETRPPLVTFQPFLQRPSPNMTLVVRTAATSDLRAVSKNVQDNVAQLDPIMPMSSLRMGREHEGPELEAMRLGARISLLLGILALAMAALGLYGVVSYAVSVRTREIGIRIALGAAAISVQSMVIRQGLGLALLGLAVGLAGSVMLTPVLERFLIGVRVVDAPTFIVVAVVLVAIALLASYLPTRRATRVDPTVALKCE